MTQPHPPFLFLLLLVVVVLASVVESHYEFIKLPSDGAGRRTGEANEDTGKNWAILVAGSTGYYNYRHQADICHAYQIMKKGGLKDENIVVFMYDDIAYNQLNPRKGVIVNRPNGENVYAGVPKDYNGENANVDNFLAVLQGNKGALTGGSGKVVNSGPNDHIFIFYSGHGGPGVLGMPSGLPLYADDLIAALKKKHASTSYKSMVFYLDSCESGSIFEGLLPEGINIYAATASKANEDSYATYYWYYGTALGDLFSVSWMEDSERSNARMETLKEQYQLVKERTSVNGTYKYGSHVMQYGNLELGDDKLGTYFGFIPGNTNAGSTDNNALPPISESVNQRDADLFYFWHKLLRAREGSSEKLNAQKQLLDALAHRSHVDNSVQLIGKLLFGTEKGSEILKTLRPAGQPLVDDWSCLKSLVRTFETYCGSLSQYGMKHMRSLANFCNAGVGMEKMAVVASQACPTIPSNPWSSLHMGLSA